MCLILHRKHFGVGISSTLDSRRSSGDGASGEPNGKLYVSIACVICIIFSLPNSILPLDGFVWAQIMNVSVVCLKLSHFN